MPLPTGRFEVVVVGGGPAGSTLARRLALAGRKVLVLEKEALPRDKPCSGSLPSGLPDLLGFECRAVLREACSRLRGLYRGGRPFFADRGRPFAYTVRRDEFDGLLLGKAEEAGAEVLDRAEVLEVEAGAHGARVRSSRGDFECEVVAGADGAGSVVSRRLGLRRPKRCGRAAVCELHPEDPDLLEGYRGSHLFEFGLVPLGHAWIMPKADHLNIGVGTTDPSTGALAALLRGYVRRKFPSLPEACLRGLRIREHLLPFGGSGAPLHGARALVLGDAAGLANAVDGGGILPAVQSGLIAAEVLDAALRRGGLPDLSEYSRRVHELMLRDLRWAAAVSAVFYRMPGLSYRFITHPWFVRAHWAVKSRYSKVGEHPFSRFFSLKDLLDAFNRD